MSVSAGILHTVIFCRALGALKPQEVDCEILSNITFVSTVVTVPCCCSEPEAEGHATIAGPGCVQTLTGHGPACRLSVVTARWTSVWRRRSINSTPGWIDILGRGARWTSQPCVTMSSGLPMAACMRFDALTSSHADLQVSLLFYEKRRKAASWFGKQAEERLYWEQW